MCSPMCKNCIGLVYVVKMKFQSDFSGLCWFSIVGMITDGLITI